MLEENSWIKVAVAVVVGVAAGYPIIGVPPLRDRILRWVEARLAGSLSRQAKTEEFFIEGNVLPANRETVIEALTRQALIRQNNITSGARDDLLPDKKDP